MGRGPGNYNNNMGGNTLTNINNPANIMRPMPEPTIAANGLHLTHIADLRPAMRGFNLECILLDQAGEPRKVHSDNTVVTTFRVADKTGSVHLSIWGDDAQLLRSGDILRIQGGEARLFKNQLQMSITKAGKFRKIGEDTMVFTELPNWSEVNWEQEMNKPGMMGHRATQMAMNTSTNGIQPMPGGPNIQQHRNIQGNNAQPAINPAFRGDQRQGQRPFQHQGNMNASPHGNSMMGPGMGMMNQAGFQGNNSGNMGGPGMIPSAPMPQQQLPQSQQRQQNMNAQGVNGPPIGQGMGQGGHRSHHGGHPNQSNQPNQPNQNHGHHQQAGNAGRAGAHPSLPPPPNSRPPKHKKHNKFHRDLDAPETSPASRTGLDNIEDEFAREMNSATQGLRQGPGRGGPGSGSGGAAGAAHVRKKPKVVNE
ncbi:SOSS complex subunit B1 [Mortierella polycephala]|uniref:SOSS complex subunit B1 n=1 Tax=Mortierella polycephala TaxID=41804 RepID=A0A9P6QDC0_9FUNG|nr:SOSS complex subunit B1 [Mortierella polycephala]